jgi:hypothetical protein
MNRDLVAPLCRHPLNDAHLLRILRAEVRLVGANKIEEPRDDGRHTGKVSGAGGTLKSRGERAWINRRNGLIGRVDLVNAREEEQVRTSRLGNSLVRLEGSRVLGYVCSVRELSRVDEDRNDHRRGGGARGGDQRSVPGMQRPHRGYQRNWARELGERLVEFRTSDNGTHRPNSELAWELV